jgi:hypothetical protein
MAPAKLLDAYRPETLAVGGAITILSAARSNAGAIRAARSSGKF